MLSFSARCHRKTQLLDPLNYLSVPEWVSDFREIPCGRIFGSDQCDREGVQRRKRDWDERRYGLLHPRHHPLGQWVGGQTEGVRGEYRPWDSGSVVRQRALEVSTVPKIAARRSDRGRSRRVLFLDSGSAVRQRALEASTVTYTKVNESNVPESKVHRKRNEVYILCTRILMIQLLVASVLKRLSKLFYVIFDKW